MSLAVRSKLTVESSGEMMILKIRWSPAFCHWPARESSECSWAKPKRSGTACLYFVVERHTACRQPRPGPSRSRARHRSREPSTLQGSSRWNTEHSQSPGAGTEMSSRNRLLESLTLLARLDREGDLLTRRTRRRRFFAVPVTRRGDVFVGLIRPGRTFVERSRSSPVFCRFRAEDGMADVRPHLMVLRE